MGKVSIHLFNHYLLSAHFMPDTVPGIELHAGNKAVKKLLKSPQRAEDAYHCQIFVSCFQY